MGLAPGMRVGAYEVVGAIGAGGMGEVYRARDTKLGRDVALKVLPEAFSSDPERLGRFEREAKVLASLNHPNIAAIYGFEDSDGVHALAMELVEGQTLAERIGETGARDTGARGAGLRASATQAGAKGAVALDEALPIAKQIAEGLEYAHERGIVHRDLKPANVKITPEDTVKLLDFGLAKALEGEAGAGDISTSPTISRMATQAGVILGTAAYMSPEQAKGRPVDRRADIWAFGCVFYEMLAGKPAFGGETVTDVLASVVKEEPDWSELPETMPPAIRRLLTRCLKKDAKQRLQAIGEARIALDEAVSGTGEEFPPAAAGATPQPLPAWRRFLPWAIAAALGVALVAVVSMPRRPARSNAQPVVRAVVPVSTRLGVTGVALSPDGSRLAYAGFGSSGNSPLAWRDLARRETADISGVQEASFPFFSPDGRKLGVFSGNKLMSIDLSVGTPQEICEAPGGSGASWGEDGTIVFTDSAGLFAVSAAGGQPRPLLAARPGSQGFAFPEILPGRRIVLVTATSNKNQPDVVLVPFGKRGKSGTPTVLLRGAVDAQYLPSGQLVFDKGGDLNAVPFDLKHLRVAGPPVNLHIPVAGVNLRYWANYSIARNGTLAYAVAGEEYSDNSLVWVDRKGNVVPLPLPQKRYSDPQISPDGQRFVVGVGGGGNVPQNLWLFDFRRQILSRLTFGNQLDFAPVWTPDGKHIVFISPGSPWRLFIIPSDGSGPKKQIWSFANAMNAFPVSFSPDGRALALVVSNGKHDAIEILHFPGADATQPSGPPSIFFSGPFNNERPEFSPDGRWIAYGSDESGSPQIYVRPYPGPGGQVQISPDGGTEPRWSRDGRTIFYRDGDKMMAVSVTTGPHFSVGRPQFLFQGHYMEPGAVLNYAVSPDGSRFLMERRAKNTASPEIDVLVNWGAQVPKLMQQAKQ